MECLEITQTLGEENLTQRDTVSSASYSVIEQMGKGL